MEMLFGIDASLPYAQRVEGLAQAGASLWDVVAECERPGSADSRIVRSSVRLNDLASFVAELPELRAIAFNGGEAFRAFIEGHRGYVTAGERLSIRFGSRSIEAFKMPSTSPANAAFSLERLYGSWFPLAEPR
jgi:hypoxanthine-DNA glycosylase